MSPCSKALSVPFESCCDLNCFVNADYWNDSRDCNADDPCDFSESFYTEFQGHDDSCRRLFELFQCVWPSDLIDFKLASICHNCSTFSSELHSLSSSKKEKKFLEKTQISFQLTLMLFSSTIFGKYNSIFLREYVRDYRDWWKTVQSRRR